MQPKKILVYIKNLKNSRYIKFKLIKSHTDYAWDVILDFANELLEKEQADELNELSEIMDRKAKEKLAFKRSFFVRMVSDPNIYNPAINKAGTPQRMSQDVVTPVVDGAPIIQTPSGTYVFQFC